MYKYWKFLLAVPTLTLMIANPVLAQKPTPQGWQFTVGAGGLFNPAFKGSKDYQLSILPYLKLNYQDKFFASVQEGIGFNLINTQNWLAGVLVRYRFERKEDDGTSPFQVAGSDTTALRGLGNVDGTFEPGAFVEYKWENFSAEVEVRQGVGGHEGFIGDLRASYNTNINPQGRPILFSIGPRATLVSDNYNDSYYSVNLTQSINSGLPQYQASGGLLSFGLGTTLIAPVYKRTTIVGFAGYDRLTGDAADSPLVRFRGSENQFTLGLFATYTFGR